MSIGGFFLGVVLMAAGFFMVWKTDWFLRNVGDLGTLLGFTQLRWLSWKFLGVLFMLFGFLIAFGLIQLFLTVTIGRLFTFGGL